MVNLLQVNGLRDTVAAQRLRYGGARQHVGSVRAVAVCGCARRGRRRAAARPMRPVDLLVVTLKNLI